MASASRSNSGSSHKKSDTVEQSGPGTKDTSDNFDRLAHTLLSSTTDAQKMIDQFLARQPADVKRFLDPFNLMPTALNFTKELVEDPAPFLEAQKRFAEGYLKLVENQIAVLNGTPPVQTIESDPADKRFKAEAWSNGGPFDFIKQAYLLASDSLMSLVSEAQGLDQKSKSKLTFFTKQYVDALSPSNFLFSNPVAMQKTLEEGGNNLMRGSQNLLEDLRRGKGIPLLKMVDFDAFKVGTNLAMTPGEVVFKNRLFELIQYHPVTESVTEIPLLIFPPWINKYYILDLNDKKSFVKWATEQGFTVFIVSWVNPDEKYRNLSFDDMAAEGYLEALRVVREICDVSAVNTIGYCIAGTMLAAVLAMLEAQGQADQINSATFFTSQIDFENAGDLTLFVDDEQLETVRVAAAEKGYLDKRYMALTFNMLRANDLIWSYVVNNYLLGAEPMAFDLLYWNCDSTNLPERLHLDYLEKMYQQNLLIQPGGITLGGVPIDLSTIKTPSYIQAGREDHIAPARSVYRLKETFTGDVTFMLAGSGHIAGVVNHPAAKKYQNWTGPSNAENFDDFVNRSVEHQGSWWPHWAAWLKKRSGKDIPVRQPGAHPSYKSLMKAPGSYVLMTGE